MTDYVAILQGMVEQDRQRQIVRGCKSKRRYASYIEARAFTWGRVQGIYYCQNCGGYHLTSQKGQAERSTTS